MFICEIRKCAIENKLFINNKYVMILLILNVIRASAMLLKSFKSVKLRHPTKRM